VEVVDVLAGERLEDDGAGGGVVHDDGGELA
jgi:hypothetical protein